METYISVLLAYCPARPIWDYYSWHPCLCDAWVDLLLYFYLCLWLIYRYFWFIFTIVNSPEYCFALMGAVEKKHVYFCTNVHTYISANVMVVWMDLSGLHIWGKDSDKSNIFYITDLKKISSFSEFWLDRLKLAELIISVQLSFHPSPAHKVMRFSHHEHLNTIEGTDLIIWWLDYYMSVEIGLPEIFYKQLH